MYSCRKLDVLYMISIHIQKKISSMCSHNLQKIASHNDEASQYANLYCDAYVQYRIQSYKTVQWWGVTVSLFLQIFRPKRYIYNTAVLYSQYSRSYRCSQVCKMFCTWSFQLRPSRFLLWCLYSTCISEMCLTIKWRAHKYAHVFSLVYTNTPTRLHTNNLDLQLHPQSVYFEIFTHKFS